MSWKSIVAGAIGAFALGLSAAAQEWEPSGPITLEIGFGAGGETDAIGRAIAASMEEATGWDVVVVNKPGGGGIAMFSGLSQAEPDGLTLGMGVSMPVLINLTLRGDQLPFTLDSFDYLATVARAQLAVVAPADAPFDDVPGLIAYAEGQGGVVIAFDAKPQEMLAQSLMKSDGAQFQLLPTESSAESVQLLLGGTAEVAFIAGAHIEHLEAGTLKMIASANATRHDYAPDAQTLIEQGWPIYVDPYFYIAAPAGLPDDARAALSAALSDAIGSDTVSAIVVNAFKSSTVNLGAEGTRQMLDDGLEVVDVLLSE